MNNRENVVKGTWNLYSTDLIDDGDLTRHLNHAHCKHAVYKTV